MRRVSQVIVVIGNSAAWRGRSQPFSAAAENKNYTDCFYLRENLSFVSPHIEMYELEKTVNDKAYTSF